MKRREFIQMSGMSVTGLALNACAHPVSDSQPAETQPELGEARPEADEPLYRVSLAEWSLHRELQGGRMDNLDFPRVARDEFGIEAIEYVNQFFMDKPRDREYLLELRSRCEDAEVKSLLIMCDGLGNLGNPNGGRRNEAVDNHKPWVHAAKLLGCHSIRVNAASAGSYEDQQRLAADGLRKLTEYAADAEMNVIVENHGGLSSNGAWLASVVEMVDHTRCGTLPDFGNFCLDWSRREEPDAWYDRYKGVTEMMPSAKAVSAKAHDFDDDGNEVNTDFRRMMKIVLDAGYRGYVGIEYEGRNLGEHDGIKATKKLLDTVHAEISA
jgi:L-ribulose-5-phosphate 3-epimerase